MCMELIIAYHKYIRNLLIHACFLPAIPPILEEEKRYV